MGSSQHPSLSNAADAARHAQSESLPRVDCQSAEQSVFLLARMYAALSETSDAILRTKSPEELCQRVCDAAVHGGKFISAAAMIADPTGSMRVVASSGVGAEQLRDAPVSMDAALPQGQGMVGRAFREQKPSISNDFLNDERTRPWHHLARSVGAAAAAALPLIKGDVAVGALFFYSGDKGAFDDEIVKLLQRMAENVSSALDNFEQVAERLKVEQSIVQLGQMYAALSSTNEAILRANSPEELFQMVCEAAVHYSKFLATAVLLLEPDGTWVRVAAMAGPAEQQLRFPKISVDETLPEGQGLVGITFRTNKPCISNDYLNDERLQSWRTKTQKAGVAAAAGLPLLVGGRPIGVLYFCSNEKGIFNGEIVNLLERIAKNVSFALDNFEHETQRRCGEQALRESEEKYRLILGSIEEAYYEVDLLGNLVLFNAALCKLLGYSERELTGMNNRQYQTPEMAASTLKQFGSVYRTGVALKNFDWEIVRKDGNKMLGEGSVNLVRDVQGEAIGFRGMLRDVTARRQTEQALRESEVRFRATFAQAAVGIAHVARSGLFLVANDKLCDILKYPRSELLQKTVKDISHPEDRDLTDDMRARLLAGEIATFSAEQRYRRRDGSDVWVRLTASLARNAAGEPDYDITVVEDITARKQAEARIQYLAHHDGLTTLPNRTLFSEMLNAAIQQSRRHKRGFAVLFIDLDRFKNINDTLGHEAGDKLLQAMGTRLTDTVRASDIVARLGGDEFVVLVHEVSEIEHVSTVARKILSAFIRPVTINGQECRVTASIGICMYPGDAQDEQSIMKNADIAMYHAKEEGKNNFQFYSRDMKAQSIERMALETSLRRGLEREEFFLHYQAKLDLKTGQISGVEALLRWQHPELGLVAPAQFIPLAEETGLIVPLGKWVLRTACAQNVLWQRAGLPPICMAVNLSMRQFANDFLLQDVADALKDSGMKPELLELELTESMVMHNADRAGKVLASIKQMGVRLAIDDFGVGYSSLAQIKRFPIDTLKVDRSFIRNLPQNPEDRAITEAIIAMARTLSLTVVAEGVETVAQETFLREHACDESQGFYFSKPVAADQFADLLRNHVAAPNAKRTD